MNFREYASKLKTKAAAAAKKLPTFDDMAANDDYIHSEDFNVRGQPKPQPQSEKAEAINQPDETSSMSSWSLLDRPSQRRTPAPSVQETTPSPSSSLQDGIHPSRAGSTNTSISSETHSSISKQMGGSSSHLPLLSVVANALEDSPMKQADVDSEALDDSVSYDSDDSDSSDDDDDPILTMIRDKKSSATKQKKKLRRQQKKERKKPGQRFLDDLDTRMAVDVDQAEAQHMLQTDSQATETPKHQVPAAIMSSPIGSWMKNVAAKNNLGRFLPRQTEASKSGTSQPAAPLARQKTKLAAKTKAPEEDFQVASSSSFLEDDELAQLAKFQASNKPTMSSKLMESMYENRQFAFILFTLLLAGFVYYFQESADDVT